MNDDEIVAGLRRLGAQHEPDSEAIWARVDPARTGADDVVPVVSLDSRRDRDLRGADRAGAPRSRPRAAVLVPLAAAAVLGVLVVSQVVTRPGDVATAPAVSPTAALPTPATTTPPRLSPSASGSPSTGTVGTAVVASPRTRTRTVTVTVPDDAPSGSSATAPSVGRTSSTSRAADLGVGAPSLVPLLGPARGLLVQTPQVDDWVVVGARSDGAQVRAKRPTYPQAPLVVTPPAGALVARSPLAVSWGDGLPEQSRFGATTWLSAGAGRAWTVTTQRLDVPRRLTIVGGGAPSGVRLDVVGPGRRGSWTWSGNPAGSGPFTLSVELPGGVGPVTVTLTPLGGDGLAVSTVSAVRI